MTEIRSRIRERIEQAEERKLAATLVTGTVLAITLILSLTACGLEGNLSAGCTAQNSAFLLIVSGVTFIAAFHTTHYITEMREKGEIRETLKQTESVSPLEAVKNLFSELVEEIEQRTEKPRLKVVDTDSD